VAGLSLGVGILAILKVENEWRTFLLIGCAAPFVFMLSRSVKRLCLALLILCVPINADVNFIYRPHHGGASGLGIHLIDIPLIGLCLYGLIDIARKRRPWTGQLTRAAFPLLGFLLCALVSLFNAADVQFGLFEIVRLIEAMLIFFIIGHLVNGDSEIHLILRILIIGLLLESAMALVQGYLGQSLGLSLLGESEKVAEQHLETVGSVTRVWGTFGSSNIFAFYLQCIVPVPIALLFSRTTAASKMLWLIAAIAGTMALLFTLSRGGWLGFASSVVIIAGFHLFRGKLTLAKVMALACIGGLVGLLVFGFSDLIFGRLFSDDGESAYLRVPMMQVAWAIIKAHPVLGVGINNYTVVMRTYDSTAERVSLWFDYPVHNEFLLLAAEIGLFGLVFFMAFMLSLFKIGWSAVKRHPRESIASQLTIGIMAGLIGFLVHCLGDFPLLSNFTLFWVLAGLLCASAKRTAPRGIPLTENCFVKFITITPLCLQRNK